MSLDTTKIDAVLEPVTPAEDARREKRVRASFFGTMKRALRQIPFAEDVVASYHCALDPNTPTASRGILLAALAYFVLPFDFMPDVMPFLGFADDAAVLLAAWRAVSDNIQPEHYLRARETLRTLED